MADNKNGSPTADDWAGPDGELGTLIAEQARKTLNAYRKQPHFVTRDANQEEDTARGGYAHRQLFELVQNSADALASTQDGGHIVIRLTDAYLYCADNGRSINLPGVTALMFSHMSPKRGSREIGRFGLGFKSVLGVTDMPEFFSRSGSFRFDRGRSRSRIQEALRDTVRCPALCLPDPIDPCEERDKDDTLRELMGWATNVVRLPLEPGAHGDLREQMDSFPPEFLLFVEHVNKLTLNDGQSELGRILELENVDGEYLLADGETSQWKLFKCIHSLSSDALADRRSLDDGDEVLICWAAPLDRLTEPGYFWAFFPTQTASLVAGILNAPWKTNEDRQNLLAGPYNDELIDAAAEMVAKKLPELSTREDPARHLDALPRRHGAGDSEQVDRLRKQLFFNLNGREIVPDQDGELRPAGEISYPPKELTDGQVNVAPFERWASSPGRPSDWLHHKALTRNRLATIDRLYPPRWPGQSPAAPRAMIAEWLKALVKDQEPENFVGASKAAIQTAALISPETRLRNGLGDIVLTASGGWQAPDPERLFLPDEASDSGDTLTPNSFVHSELTSDRDTLAALKELGIKPPSPESNFELIAKRVLSSWEKPEETPLWLEFWTQARKVEVALVQGIIRKHGSWGSGPRVRTRSGGWQPPHSVLLPGEVVPGDGNRDDDATVDTDFHEPDSELLRSLGVTGAPYDQPDLSPESWFQDFQRRQRNAFTSEGRALPQTPRWGYLNFASTSGSGPLDVLTALSDEGRARYTCALLSLDATYKPWEMWHDTRDYQKLPCESPAIHMLREEGRIQTANGVVPFADALGPQPKSPEALHSLLAHPKAEKIKEAFDLTEPIPEFIGEEDAVPLTDVWPGLEEHIPEYRKTCQLIRCERILVAGQEKECIRHATDIYLTDTVGDDDYRELRLVSRELELGLDERQLEAVLRYEMRREIEERRAAVRECSTDAERLLEAVGEETLRQGLPSSLLAILETEDVAFDRRPDRRSRHRHVPLGCSQTVQTVSAGAPLGPADTMGRVGAG